MHVKIVFGILDKESYPWGLKLTTNKEDANYINILYNSMIIS